MDTLPRSGLDIAVDIAVTQASVVHATTSLMAAQAMDTWPSLVNVSRWSARIRARTGNAVILIETAINRENGSIGESGARRCNGRASAKPAEKGMTMLSKPARPAT